ncbi:MAG: MFS transporter [Candidatus Levybacteria bacterium]|nr:MFS transporter [Candidatus Levybacteria bacterium]
MDRNIQIAYILTIFKNTWFWLGIWIFYYLRFTDYAGIGLIETSLVIAMAISEIPTGAVADLLGKKKTLFVSFLLQAIGGYMMAFAPHVSWLIVAVFIMGIGGAFYSGTLEALVYDSLKQKGQEATYNKVISHITSLGLAVPAICSILGGFLYIMQPNLPFLANALAYSLALIFCLFLIEPKIDTEKFSMKNLLVQTQYGFHQLFKENYIRKQMIILLAIGLVVVICDEMLNSFLGVEFGFKPESIGILWAVIYLVSAFASQLTPYITKFMPYDKSIILIGVLIAVSLIVSPWLGLVIGGFSLLLRSSLQAVYGNVSSIIINDHTESRYRATTLSTFNLIKNIPYVLTAYLLGSMADTYSAVVLASILGVVLMIMLLYPLFGILVNRPKI